MTETGSGSSSLFGRLRLPETLVSPLFLRYRRFLDRLTRREQRLLRILLSLLFVIGLWYGFSGIFWEPYLQAREELESLKGDMLQVQTLSSEIEKTRALLSSQSRRLGLEERGFSLISYLEEEADRARIKPLITQMTPRTLPPEGSTMIRMVSMRIESIDLPHAVFFLARLERSPHFIQITRLSMKRRFNNHGKLDIQLDVEAVTPS